MVDCNACRFEHGGVGAVLAVLALFGGCRQPDGGSELWSTASGELDANPPAAAALPHAVPPIATVALTPADTTARSAPRLERLDVVLTVLLIRIPHAARAAAEPLWSHLREDLFDAGTAERLTQNGLRVGIGNRQWWEAVKAVLDSIPGVQTVPLDPVRLPANYPLALELDRGPREQTLFFVAEDGVLTGETWPASRNVLRISYDVDLANPERVRLAVVPEVRQRTDELRWVRTPGGFAQQAQAGGRAFPAAGLVAYLEPGEFLLIAPGREADAYGIVGGAFLTALAEGERLDAYVFLRADVNHVACRN